MCIEIKEYEGDVNVSEFDLRQMAMMGDTIAHAQLDHNTMREDADTEVRIVRLNAEEVEVERREIEMSGLLHSPPIHDD